MEILQGPHCCKGGVGLVVDSIHVIVCGVPAAQEVLEVGLVICNPLGLTGCAYGGQNHGLTKGSARTEGKTAAKANKRVPARIMKANKDSVVRRNAWGL
jgi:hypothetical protein